MAAVVLMAGLASMAGAQVRDIGDITVEAERDVLLVRVESPSDELQRLAQGAFGAHGRFRLAGRGDTPQFTFRFTPEGDRGVDLEILSGSPAQSLLREGFTGTTRRQALLRAGDRAVQRTTGLTGFFASRLAFVGARTGFREIYTSDLFFGEVRQLTNDRSESIMPRWSPDGRYLLYTSYFQTGFPDIFRIDTVAERRDPFVSLQGTNTGARFSPDGRRVAMILSGEGNPDVYVSNAEGRQIRRLARTPGVEATPSWSPDGNRLVVTSDLAGRPQLYLLAATGGNLQRIATDISGYCAEPDWNPADPDLIAFTIAQAGRFQVAVYSFSERRSRVVTTEAGDAIEPHWLADGRHLLYTARTAASERIMLLDTITGRATRLSPDSLGKCSHAAAHFPRR